MSVLSITDISVRPSQSSKSLKCKAVPALKKSEPSDLYNSHLVVSILIFILSFISFFPLLLLSFFIFSFCLDFALNPKDLKV